MERNTPRPYGTQHNGKLLRAALLATTGLSALALIPQPARAQAVAPDATPQGGEVAAGNAAITQAPDATTIDQSSQRAIINWQSFNVGAKAGVQFNQPGPTAIALNRVVSPSPSIIAGQINANGQIVLVNQSGVVVTKGADINAESVVLATSNINDKDFMAGNMVFAGAPNPGAKIINDGNITVKDTGLVGLVAPQVENNGVINARLGVVSLAGAAAFTLDLYGDRLISLDVTKAVRAVDVGGKLVAALVTNRGLILADGGTITLTAQDADALVTQLIDAGGTLRADAVSGQTGKISISGIGGDITIAGNLLARGTAAGTTGGSVQALTTGTVAIAPAAVIDTSGAAGGGEIALGTDLKRAVTGPSDTAAPKAAAVVIAAGASVASNATGQGDGGKVTVLSSQKTDVAGSISATGGRLGGNGGDVEISGDAGYGLTGPVSVAAPDGLAGTILIDPDTLIIQTGGTSAITGDGAHGGTLFGGGGTASIDPIEFTTLTGNVELAGSIEINILTSIVSASLNSLLLEAPTIASGSAGSISLSAANARLSLVADTLALGAEISAPTIELAPLTDGATQTISAAEAGLINDPTLLRLGAYTPYVSLGGTALPLVTSAGDINLGAGGSGLHATTIALDSTGSIGNTGLISAANGITINAGGGIFLAGGTLTAPDVSLSGASLQGVGALDAATLLDLGIAGTITQGAGSITAGELLTSGATSTGIDLSGAGNRIGTLAVTTAGLVDILDAVPVTIAPTLTGASVVLASPTLNLSASASIASAAGGTVALGTDAFVLGTGNTILAPGGTIEIAPFTPGSALGLGDVSAAGTLGISQSLVSKLDPTAALFLGSGLAGSPAAAVRIDAPISFSGTGITELSTAGAISDNAGTLSAGDLVLSGASVQQNVNAAFNAATLGGAGAFTGNVVLPGTANLITTLAAFGLGANTLSVFDNRGLTVGGSLAAGAITLAASALTFDADVSAAGELSLASLGDISAPAAAISAGTLGGSAGHDVILTDAANNITTLGNFTLPDSGGGGGVFDLTDGAALAIPGTLIASQADIAAPTLNLGGGITLFSGLTLAGASLIGIAGAISAGSYVDLLSTGGITETGAITTGTLAGGLDAAGVTLTGANDIGTLGGFNAAAFAFTDTAPLDVAGPLVAGGAVLTAPKIVLAGGISVTSSLEFAGITGGITQTSGVIIAPTLGSTGSIGGNVLLSGDSITTLGGFALGTASAFGLADLTSLTVAGPLDGGAASIAAPGISLAGNISLAGGLTLASAGGIAEAAGASLSTPTLSGTASGFADFSGTNTIATLAAFTAGDFSLVDETGLSVAAALTAGAITLAAGGTLALAGPLNGTAGNVALISNGLSLAPGATVAAAAAIALVPFTPGPVTFSSPGSAFSAPTLALGAADGFAATTLVASGNDSFAGTLLLGASSLVEQSGSLTAQQIDLSAASISVGGAVSASLVSLASSGVASDTGTLTATTLKLGTGSFIEGAGAGAITAATLTGTGGGLTLASLGNQIGTLGAVSLSGDLILGDGELLTVAAPVQAGGVTLTGAAAAGIALASGASFTAGGVDLVADAISAAAGSNFGAGSVTLSPYAATEIDLGGTAANALDVSQAVITAANGATLLQLGVGPASLAADGVISAGVGTLLLDGTGIAFNGALTAPGGLQLEFPTTGTASESNTAVIRTSSLSGAGVVGDVLLANGANTIGSIAGLDVGGSLLTLSDTDTLAVNSPLSVPNLSLFAPGIFVSSVISASSAVLLEAASSIGITGSIDTGILLLGLSGPGQITEAPAGAITAANLGSTGAFSGAVALTGANNSIGTLEGFSATSFALTGDTPLTQTGALDAGIITLAAPGISISGSIDASSLLALDSTGGITEAGAITTPTLTSGGGVGGGNINLDNPANSIATLAGFSLSSGQLTLDDGVALQISGPLGAPAAAIYAPSIGVTGAINTSQFLTLSGDSGIGIAAPVNAGLALDLMTNGNVVETGAGTVSAAALAGTLGGDLDLPGQNAVASIGNLALPAGQLTLGNTVPLNLAGNITAANASISAPAISLTGALLTPGTLALTSTGGDIDIALGGFGSAGAGISLSAQGNILETQAGTLAAPVLRGSASGYALFSDAANRIGTLAGFAANGTLLLDDSGLLVAAGSLQGANISLSAGTLDLTGSLLAPAGTVAIAANSGGIAQTGGLIDASDLTSDGQAVTGAVALALANSIASLGNFTVSGANFSLNDTGPLSVTGAVDALYVALSAPGITVPGYIGAGDGIRLNAAGLIGVTGTLDTAGILLLGLSGAGNVSESSTGLIAATSVAGAGAIDGAVALLGAGNEIGTLGNFSATNFSATDAGKLAVHGNLTAPGVTLNAAGISISGSIDASNLLALGSSAGVAEYGGGITAGTLTSGTGDAGSVLLTGNLNSIANLAGFSLSSGAFDLNDAVGLNISGPVSASSGSFAAPSIGITGAISAGGALALDGASGISIGGPVDAGTQLTLASGGAITETGPAGTISAPAVSGAGAIGGNLDLGQANAIGTLTNVLLSSGNLTVDDTTGLTLAGNVQALDASLAAASLYVAGGFQAGALHLASAGNIGEAGAGHVVAASLTGTAGGGVNLAAGQNSISSLAGFTAGGYLDVGSQTQMNVTGTVSGSNVLLSAGSLGLQAPVLAPGGTIALAAATGITQTGGTLNASVLTSNGTLIGGPVALNQPGNQIGTVAAFDLSSGNFGLTDTGVLSIASLSAPSVSLAAAEILVPGLLNASTSAALNATGGIGVTGTGAIDSALLRLGLTGAGGISEDPGAALNVGSLASIGAINGAVQLASNLNQINTLGSFSAASLTLADASPLAVTGPVNAANINLTAASLDVTGAIDATAAASLSGTDGITLAAPLSTGTLTLLSQNGGVTQTAGIITASTVTTGGGSIAGATSLDDGNLIGTLVGFTDGGNLSVASVDALTASDVTAVNTSLSGAGLTLSGPVNTGTLQLASSVGVTQTAGRLSAAVLASGGAITGDVTLNAGPNSIGTIGDFAATGGLTLADSSALILNGAVQLGGNLALDAASLTQTGGRLSAAALTNNGGGIGGLVLLTEPGNQIPVLGNFTAAGPVIITDADPLSLTGLLSTGGNPLTLDDTGGAISEAGGTVDASVFNASGPAILLGDANNIGVLGNVSTPGNLVVDGVGGITGPVQAGNANLTAPGGFNINGAVSVTGQLLISAAGDVTQPGGALTAQNATLSGANISLSGTDHVTGDLALLGLGNVTQNAGNITAGTLTGTGNALASFGQGGATADFGILGKFTSADSAFNLTNAGPLTIIGPVVANILHITANGALVLDGSAAGGLYITGGLAPVDATLAQDTAYSELAATTIMQTGTFDINYPVLNANGAGAPTPATIYFVTTGGNITFGGAPGGLFAPSVDVIVSAGDAGQATGNIDVEHLEVIGANFTELTGTIDGISGQPAAGKASAEPVPLSKYQFNACPIGSVNCVILAIEAVPTANPLQNFDISQRKRRRLDKNVQLPGIATHDF